MEEMGIRCEMHEAFTFIYMAPVGEGLTEHEFDHVWVGISDTEPLPDSTEVDSWKYMRLEDIRSEMEVHPELFT